MDGRQNKIFEEKKKGFKQAKTLAYLGHILLILGIFWAYLALFLPDLDKETKEEINGI